jgi:hypothetical protein
MDSRWEEIRKDQAIESLKHCEKGKKNGRCDKEHCYWWKENKQWITDILKGIKIEDLPDSCLTDELKEELSRNAVYKKYVIKAELEDLDEIFEFNINGMSEEEIEAEIFEYIEERLSYEFHEATKKELKDYGWKDK